MPSRHAKSCGVSSDSVPLMRSRNLMDSRDRVRSPRTNSGIFAPSWFNSQTMLAAVQFVLGAWAVESLGGREITSGAQAASLRSCLHGAALGRDCWGQHTNERRDPDVTQNDPGH